MFTNLRTRLTVCRKHGHNYQKDGVTLGGDWIRCINCKNLEEFLPGVHEPKGYDYWLVNINHPQGKHSFSTAGFSDDATCDICSLGILHYRALGSDKAFD